MSSNRECLQAPAHNRYKCILLLSKDKNVRFIWCLHFFLRLIWFCIFAHICHTHQCWDSLENISWIEIKVASLGRLAQTNHWMCAPHHKTLQAIPRGKFPGDTQLRAANTPGSCRNECLNLEGGTWVVCHSQHPHVGKMKLTTGFQSLEVICYLHMSISGRGLASLGCGESKWVERDWRTTNV